MFADHKLGVAVEHLARELVADRMAPIRQQPGALADQARDPGAPLRSVPICPAEAKHRKPLLHRAGDHALHQVLVHEREKSEER